MANYSREDAEKQGNAEVGSMAALILGGAAFLAHTVVKSQMNDSRKKKIAAEIQDIDKKIADYKSAFLGSIVNSDEISKLEKKRKELRKEYDQA